MEPGAVGTPKLTKWKKWKDPRFDWWGQSTKGGLTPFYSR